MQDPHWGALLRFAVHHGAYTGAPLPDELRAEALRREPDWDAPHADAVAAVDVYARAALREGGAASSEAGGDDADAAAAARGGPESVLQREEEPAWTFGTDRL